MSLCLFKYILIGFLHLGFQEMSEEDKQVWNNMAAEAMEAYKKELEEYNKAKEQNNNNNWSFIF